MNNQLDVLFHPVRIRVIQCFLPDQSLTVRKLEKKLDDVSPASLYRHVNKLVEAGMLEIRDQQQIRGTIKYSYGLSKSVFQVSKKNSATDSDEENLKSFTAFTAFLQAEYQRYLANPDKDFIKDGFDFRAARVYVTDEEFNDWTKEFQKLTEKLTNNQPGDGRKQRTIAHIFIPGIEEKDNNGTGSVD